MGQPHFAAAVGAGHTWHGRVGRCRRNEDAEPPFDFLGETRHALAQFVASRQHDPAALNVQIFRLVVFIVCGSCPRTALAGSFVAIRNLS